MSDTTKDNQQNDPVPPLPTADQDAVTDAVAMIEETIHRASETLATPELAENGPVCRDVRRLCEQLNLAQVALTQGRDSLGHVVTPREVGASLREAIDDLVVYGSWLRLDMEYSDEARISLAAIRDRALAVVSRLMLTPETGSQTPTVKRAIPPVPVPPPSPSPDPDKDTLPATVRSLRPPLASPGRAPLPETDEPPIGGDTLNIRRLGQELPPPGPLKAPKPPPPPVQPQDQPILPAAPPPVQQPRKRKSHNRLPLIGAIGLIVLMVAGSGVAVWRWHLAQPAKQPLIIEPLPEAFVTASTASERRHIFIAHIAAQLNTAETKLPPDRALAKLKVLYTQQQLGPWPPTQPRISPDIARTDAEIEVAKAMKAYPTYDARPAVAEAARIYPVYAVGDTVTVQWQVNPERIVEVNGEFKGLAGGTVTIGNREIRLDDIIATEPHFRDRFDKLKIRQLRQTFIEKNQREYEAKRAQTQARYLQTYRERARAHNAAANEEHGYLLDNGTWKSPEELARQLLQP